MSQENVEIVRRLFEVSHGPDRRSFEASHEREAHLEAILGFLDPEIVWEVRSDLPDAETYVGYEGIRGLFMAFREVLDETWYRPLEFIEAGDRVIVPLRWGGRGKASGVEVAQPEEAWVYTLRDGKIVHVKEYATKYAALEAAGLSE
jgi:ketosteroid isomerase-like protein